MTSRKAPNVTLIIRKMKLSDGHGESSPDASPSSLINGHSGGATKMESCRYIE